MMTSKTIDGATMNEELDKTGDKKGKLPKISRRQVFLQWTVATLADGGRRNLDEDEPSKKIWFGLRIKLFHFMRRLHWNEARRLRAKYGNTTYRKRS